MEEITNEVKKFGTVKSIMIPRTRDMVETTTVKESAIGKAFIEFEEVTSAFACYNLLNAKPFMNMPVEINFFSKDMFLTKSLY